MACLFLLYRTKAKNVHSGWDLIEKASNCLVLEKMDSNPATRWRSLSHRLVDEIFQILVLKGVHPVKNNLG